MGKEGQAESSQGVVGTTSARAHLARLLCFAKEGRKKRSTGRDGFPVFEDDPMVEVQSLLNAYLKQISRQQAFWKINPEKWPAGRTLLAGSADEKVLAIRALLVRLLHWQAGEDDRAAERERNVLNFDELMVLVKANLKGKDPKLEKLEREEAEDPMVFRSLAVELLRHELTFTEDDLETLVDLVADQNLVDLWFPLPGGSVLRAVEQHLARTPPSAALREQLNRWRWAVRKRNRPHKHERNALTRLDALLGDEPKHTAPMEAGEAWSNAAREVMQRFPPDLLQRWTRLLQHCRTAETSKPTGKWLKAARDLVEKVGREEFKTRVIPWFELVALPRPVHCAPRSSFQPDPDQLITDKNSLILKGLAWCCAGWEDAELSRALGGLAEVCFKKVRNLGARCPRVGNACLYSLAATVSEEAAGQLSRLDQKIKGHSAKKLIGKSLNKAAELSGQTREDLEESSVPTYGFDAQGMLRQTFGDFTAELTITGSDSTELLWRKGGGKPQRSVPAEVKKDQAEALTKFKRTLKDIDRMLPAQRVRIERLLASERDWPLDRWRARYLEHPLLAHLARRLIWHFRLGDRSSLGIWHRDKLVDVQNKPLTWLAPETRVRLWHPLGFEPEIVLAWRRWLEEQQVAQPFKQAHREIYVLTDAELRTGRYSNRFAAHILKQHQFAALARQRGWRYSLMGSFDVQSTPTLVLPHCGLAAEFYVDGHAGDEMTASGVAPYLATDQVRFQRQDADDDAAALELRDVPAVVFSEVMRDVDLFVAVCSVGNDPAWQDGGEVEGGGDYWRRYSFGNLGATASTRKDTLERLVPRLKIAGRCSFSDKFLVVKGSLRTYKIHLGSGNILMEPNDQYLCIVPGRSTAATDSQVFLPFEGDTMLSIILSKAFLLAEDDQIKDQTIVSQIRLGA
jgi:hypothetical protein